MFQKTATDANFNKSGGFRDFKPKNYSIANRKADHLSNSVGPVLSSDD